MKIKEDGASKKKVLGLTALGCILALIVGGNNYATSLSMVCLFWGLSLLYALFQKKSLAKTLPITLIASIGLLVCVLSPGNDLRLEQEFGGSTMGISYAISMSFVRTGTNIYSWSTPLIFMMLAIVTPFLWIALRESKYSFKYPFLFTGFTFGIYASQITATMYVDGTTGGCRMADILYYAYHVWVLLNVGYWIGWLQRKIKLKGIFLSFGHWFRKNAALWFCISGMIVAAYLGVFGRKSLSTYRACAWLLKGDAQTYAQEWEERLDVLHDDNVKEVYFQPLPGDGGMVFYADFQQGENWVNKACAEYYDKDYVGLEAESN